MRQQNFDGKTIKRASSRRDGDCPALPIGKTGDTKSILNRCIPTILGDAADSLTDFVSSIPTVNKVGLNMRSKFRSKTNFRLHEIYMHHDIRFFIHRLYQSVFQFCLSLCYASWPV